METQTTEIEVQDKKVAAPEAGEPTWAGNYYTPSVDIHATDSETVMVADLPGVTKDGLEIDLRDGILTIVGKVHTTPDDHRLIQHEYEIGGYLRRFTLGEDVDTDRIDATLKDGVLTLVLPKSEAALPRKIEVKVG